MRNRTSFFRSGLTCACLAVAAGLSASVMAEDHGGVALGATRVIFDCSGGKETSLSLRNSSTTRSFLVQNWASDANGQKSSAFVVTPPLFMMKPDSENKLRVLYAGPPLPTDRESLFWLTSKSIPAVDKGELQGKNVLQLAIAARIKGFCRPPGLHPAPDKAPAQLTFRWQGKQLTLTNPTPYYLTVINMTANGQKLPPVMVPPKESASVTATAGSGGAVRFQTLNDFGAASPVLQGHMQ
ncbi:fimbria/pilus periplasmic chaperone [Klebsiella sp. CN_Kp098]|uniref:fimbria/pilus periplasmic chaperone n=1 Tax=unclassified Klebsiella TaxID=2608929 RepID=UPI0032B4150E